MKNKFLSAIIIVIFIAINTNTYAHFADFSPLSAHHEAIEILSKLDILRGYGDSSFMPDAKLTRAEFCALIIRAMGEEEASQQHKNDQSFSDVMPLDWYLGYISLAYFYKIANGVDEKNFMPDSNVTYGQAAAFIIRALHLAM